MLTSPFFRVAGSEAGAEALSGRETALLTGAITVQALLRPASTFRVIALRGLGEANPRLSGDRVDTATWAPERAVVAVLDVESAVPGATPPGLSPTVVLDLGGTSRPASVPVSPRLAPLRELLRRRAPLALDALRQLDTDRIEAARLRGSMPSALTAAGATPNPGLANGRKVAVLFGLHWLEVGGAEKWALDTVSLARELGAVPLVLTDRESPHPLVEHPSMRGAVFLPLTHPLRPGDDARLLNALVQLYDIRLVHIHHCSWLYERTPWLKVMSPSTHIVDSLHLSEWRTGGFVEIARRQSAAIDVHHVESPGLRDYMADVLHVDTAKMVMAPLVDLGPERNGSAAPGSASTTHLVATSTLTIGFVGRLTQQKRPFLFLALARRLHRRTPGRYHFILHGDGELEQETQHLIDRYGLGDVLQRRGVDDPVGQTYAASDVLVLTSENEGVTLVSYGAAQEGCLVVSADVGSQRSLVPDELLLPRHPFQLVHKGSALIERLAVDDRWRGQLLDQQATKLKELSSVRGARAWASTLYREVLK